MTTVPIDDGATSSLERVFRKLDSAAMRSALRMTYIHSYTTELSLNCLHDIVYKLDIVPRTTNLYG